MKKFLTFIFSITLLMSFGQTDTIKKLNIVEVEGIRADSKSPVSQKTLTKENIQKGYFGQDIPITLSSTPAITRYSDGGDYTGYMYFRLRGIDQTRINSTLNGIPLNEPEDQGAYFSNYTDFSNNINSVQIQRGVGTSSNGVASYAGSINFESPNLLDSGYTNIQSGVGSFNSSRLSVGMNTGLMKNNFAFYGRYSQTYSDGFRYHSGTDANTFFFSGGYYGKRDIVKFTAFSGHSENQMAYLAASIDDLKKDFRTNYLSSDERDHFVQNFAQLQHIRHISDNASLTSSLYYTGLQGNYGVLFAPMMANFQLFSDFYGAMTNYKYDKGNFHMNLGANASYYYRNHAMSTAPFMSQTTYSNRGEKRDLSGYLKVSYDVKKFTLFADMQERYSDFTYRPSTGDSVVEIPVSWLFFNPKAGVTYQQNNNLSYYASVGQMHREPARNDMFAGYDDMNMSNYSQIGDLTKVKPESVVDFELGTNYRSNNLYVQADIYDMEFRNEIAAIGQLSYIGLPLRENVGQSYRRGVEVDASYIIGKHFKVSGNANYMVAQIKEYTDKSTNTTYNNVTPLLTPNWIVNTNVECFCKDKFALGLSGRYVSESYLTNTGDKALMLPETNLNTMLAKNVYVKVKITKNCNLTFNVNNITNSHNYNAGYAVGTTAFYYVAPTRNYFVSLNATF